MGQHPGLLVSEKNHKSTGFTKSSGKARPYVSPALTEFGPVNALTQGGSMMNVEPAMLMMDMFVCNPNNPMNPNPLC